MPKTIRKGGKSAAVLSGGKPWGLRQFTLEDLAGHRFHFHCD